MSKLPSLGTEIISNIVRLLFYIILYTSLESLLSLCVLNLVGYNISLIGRCWVKTFIGKFCLFIETPGNVYMFECQIKQKFFIKMPMYIYEQRCLLVEETFRYLVLSSLKCYMPSVNLKAAQSVCICMSHNILCSLCFDDYCEWPLIH